MNVGLGSNLDGSITTQRKYKHNNLVNRSVEFFPNKVYIHHSHSCDIRPKSTLNKITLRHSGFDTGFFASILQSPHTK